ncbi:MAG: FAD-dependent oxidoreductase [Syntrophorhabdaceae bacterium]|nr:FAD-dependent oxidoreductase [Syntrophorhabdaceae bacterium]MDD4196051.1 FAD-dependent oxidoreductase [Syntrophorhabdaceae bacterium]
MEVSRAHILVCAGAACVSSGCRQIRDAVVNKIVEQGLQNEIKVIETGCIGSCDLGPLALVYPEGVLYQKLKPEDAEEIVTEHLLKGRIVDRLLYKEKTTAKAIPSMKEIDFFRNQIKIVLRNCGVINPMNIEEYIARDGYMALGKALTSMTREEVVDEVLKSGLRGRGGGGFPTGLKWKFAYQSPGDVKYVVCNADEGDPGAFMDRSVLEGDPHSVIEAMAIAGYAIGARQGYIYVRAEYPLAIDRLNWAIGQAREYKFLGKNILETGFNFDLEIRIGAGAFVCGEETALMISIEGKRGEPRPRPPFPVVKGLFDVPTLLNNVETYANIAAIINNGASWYAQYGTEKSKGTKVFALAGAVNNTGLVEVPMGTPLGDIVFNIGGGIKGGKKYKAAQLGGPSGGCIPVQHLNVPVDYESVAELGAIVGSGGLIVADEDTCMVDFARFFLDFIQHESCGKCPPCRIGTKRMLEILKRITHGEGKPTDIDDLIELATRIKDAALCGLGQTAPNPILSTLRYFKDEYMEHIEDKHCRAGVCSALFDAPCQNACPADQNAWGYVTLISEGKMKEAIAVIKESNPFPATLGRVCVHPCETKCRRAQIDAPVSICALKRYAADVDMASYPRYKPQVEQPKDKKVAVIGAGPAGLAGAYFLTLKGYNVTVFESLPVAGGMLAVGIPDYRLPRDVLNNEIKSITDLGVEIKYNTLFGKDITSEQLFKDGYSAILIATGAHKGQKLNIPGEEAKGVLDGVTFLRDVNLGNTLKVEGKVVVLGGGNVAIDAARAALRLGASDVSILYRRERSDMPAYIEEIDEAETEGIQIHTLVAPTSIIEKDGKVTGISCARMFLGQFDSGGRRRPEAIKGSEFTVDADMIIAAIGQVPDLSWMNGDGIKADKAGTVEVNIKTLATAAEGIFAAGDNVRGPATVVEAVGDGKNAAMEIDKFLGGDGIAPNAFHDELITMTVTYDEAEYQREIGKAKMPHLPLAKRDRNFNEVVLGYDNRAAVEEAKRCLHCYVRTSE